MSMLLVDCCRDLYFPRNLRLRSPETKRQYRLAINHFSRHIGHVASTKDLDDDLLLVWMGAMLDSGLSVMTVRERAGRILALWRFLASRRVVEKFPTVQRPPATDPQPIAMREPDLRMLFHSAAKERGSISGIPADLWWTSFLAFVFCTSERKGAALLVRADWLDLDNRVCSIPALVRKGKRKPAVYHLWPEIVPLLRAVLAVHPGRELVWPWPYDDGTYYNHLRRIVVGAGWPDDRKHKTHCLRVTHSTWREVFGGDSTRQLTHSDRATTVKYYIDSRMLPPDETKLFIPWLEPRS